MAESSILLKDECFLGVAHVCRHPEAVMMAMPATLTAVSAFIKCQLCEDTAQSRDAPGSLSSIVGAHGKPAASPGPLGEVTHCSPCENPELGALAAPSPSPVPGLRGVTSLHQGQEVLLGSVERGLWQAGWVWIVV